MTDAIRTMGFCCFVILMVIPQVALGHEVPFEKTKQFYLEAGRVQEREIDLVFDDFSLFLRGRGDRSVTYQEIRYSAITSMRYDHSAQAPEGTLPGVSAAPSQEKRNWLTIRYQQDGNPALVLLLLDPSEASDAVFTAATVTEKEVEGADAIE